MKGYEDICATLMLLAVILIGGYFYLQSEVYKQKEVLQIPMKSVDLNVDKKERLTFETLSKITEY